MHLLDLRTKNHRTILRVRADAKGRDHATGLTLVGRHLGLGESGTLGKDFAMRFRLGTGIHN
ncbi:hypothetical protein RZS08_24395, partial [Arthrospira platensis SPKY1]|nr:hypothetical protein [Arthrospira platensis SPKY1]